MKTEDRKVPADLLKVFETAPKAKALWSDLTPLARNALYYVDRVSKAIGNS
jgi:uncharacterized protein YdeI (YjbR/CyaY-like superfamily)